MNRAMLSTAMTAAVATLLAAGAGSSALGAKTRSAGAARQSAPERPCVLRSTVAGPTVRDDGKVYFRGQPDPHRSYIVAFKGDACRKLNPLAILRLESDGSRICEGDRIGAVMTASQAPGPRCVIDRLVPFSGDIDDPVPANLQE